jgi:hypothetical protein
METPNVAPPNFDFGDKKDFILPPNEGDESAKIDTLDEKTLDEAIGDEGGKGFEELAPKVAVSIKEPVNKPRGWHFKKEFVDNDGNVFNKGIFIHKVLPPKKA